MGTRQEKVHLGVFYGCSPFECRKGRTSCFGSLKNKERVEGVPFKGVNAFEARASPQEKYPLRLSQKLQKILTLKISDERVAPKIDGLKIVGIIGSDTALKLQPNRLSSALFMSGTVVSDTYKNHTWGGVIALPVRSFIVSIRRGDDLSKLKNQTGRRPITHIIKIDEYDDTSSTLIKMHIRHDQPVDALISQQVHDVIKRNDMYQR
jgi:hypothetical protein